MLAGWLDRHDPSGERRDSEGMARAVLTIAGDSVPELEAFCARRGLTVRRSARSARSAGRWAVLVVEGGSLSVQGLAEITGMYRR